MIAPMNARRPTVRRLASALCAAAVLASTSVARADDDEVPDARTAGYVTPGNNQAPDVSQKGTSAASYAALVFLAAITVGVMFKNANRSHLD